MQTNVQLAEVALPLASTHAMTNRPQSDLSLSRRLGRLLLLALVLGEGLLKDLEDLLVLDLVVGLELGQIPSGRSSQLGDTVLGDSCGLD